MPHGMSWTVYIEIVSCTVETSLTNQMTNVVFRIVCFIDFDSFGLWSDMPGISLR